MGDIIVKQDNGQIAQIDYLQKAQQYLSLVGQNIPPSLTQPFIEICQTLHLNPFLREVYAVPYFDNKRQCYNLTIITGYEVYLKRAMRTGLLNGWKTVVEKFGNDTKAICTIHRKDWEMPFVHEVLLSEYDQHNSMWKSKPMTMLKKVAEAQAFRKCFPDELGGMPYTQDEIPQGEVPVKTLQMDDGTSCEIIDDAASQQQRSQPAQPQPQPQPQPAQPQPQNPNEAAKQIQEAITHIWTIANQRELTEQDRQTIANGLQDRRNHTKEYFKQILDWLHHKPMKQGAA